MTVLIPRVKVRAGFYRVGVYCIHKGRTWAVYDGPRFLPGLKFSTLDAAHRWASDHQPDAQLN